MDSIKVNVIEELNRERDRQLFFIEKSKDRLNELQSRKENSPEGSRRYSNLISMVEKRLTDELEKVSKLTRAIELIETL